MTSALDYSGTQARATPKWMSITGWALSVLSAFMPLVGAVLTIVHPSPPMKEGLVHLGFPEHLMIPLAVVEGICAIVYLIPQTAVLGAILLTGYLGGAVASHVRVGESDWFAAVLMGIFAWLGLFLRDGRLRVLIPLRR